ADAGGRILKVTSSGQPNPTPFAFPPRLTPMPTSAPADTPSSGATATPSPTPTPAREMLSSPALTEDRLYFGYPDGKVYAVDKLSGDVCWTVETEGEVTSSPAV